MNNDSSLSTRLRSAANDCDNEDRLDLSELAQLLRVAANTLDIAEQRISGAIGAIQLVAANTRVTPSLPTHNQLIKAK